MEGLLNLSRFYTCLGQSRVRQPPAHAGCGFFPPTGTRIVDELGRLREYQGDGFATDPVPSNYPHGARARAERGASRCTAE